MIWALYAGFAAACDQPTTVREVAVTLNRAVDAFFDLESDKLKAASIQLRHDVECLGEPVQQRQAADVHRVEALVSFLSRDNPATLAHLRAAILIEPDYDLRELVPKDHPLQKLNAQAKAELSAGARPIVTLPTRTAFWDGYAPGVFDLGWTGLLQMSNTRGTVLENDWIEPGEPLPKPPEIVPAAPSRTVLAVAVGLRSIVGNPAFTGSPLAVDMARARIGRRRNGWEVGGTIALSAHDGKDVAVQFAENAAVFAPGDAVLIQAGIYGGRAIPAGSTEIVPSLELGLALFESPMTQESWETNVVPFADTSRALTPSEFGPYAGLSVLVRSRAEAPVHLFGGLGGDLSLAGKPLVTIDLRGGFETTF